MDLRLQGKKAVVSGGSRGIGKAIACQLAREGVDCVICARTEEPLRAAAAELARETGGRVIPVVAELPNLASIQNLMAKAVGQLGGIDILVNNAGRVAGGVPEDLAHVTDEMILRDFEEKIVGYLRCIREVVPHMRATGWGRIINISGLAARTAGNISAGARNVSTVHLTKTLAVELGPQGINVNALYSGTTRTEAQEERLRQQAQARKVSLEDMEREVGRRNSIRRLVTTEEFGSVAAFLASPLAVGINGEVIAVSGGSGNSVYY